MVSKGGQDHVVDRQGGRGGREVGGGPVVTQPKDPGGPGIQILEVVPLVGGHVSGIIPGKVREATPIAFRARFLEIVPHGASFTTKQLDYT
jgi:hypothetical protein